MSRPPELWACIIANAGLFVISATLTTLSDLAYRQSGNQPAYKYSTLGFGFIVLGGLVEPVYEFGVRGDYDLDGTELLVLQTGEGTLIALGLGLLYYAITHGVTGSSTSNDRPAVTGEASYERGTRQWD